MVDIIIMKSIMSLTFLCVCVCVCVYPLLLKNLSRSAESRVAMILLGQRLLSSETVVWPLCYSSGAGPIFFWIYTYIRCILFILHMISSIVPCTVGKKIRKSAAMAMVNLDKTRKDYKLS